MVGTLLQSRRLPLALLAAAMCVSVVWLLSAGQGTTFGGDEIFYYARYVSDGFADAPEGGIEYFLAPHNGHFVPLGKLVYQALFLTAGTDYFVFRAVEAAGVIACVGLFFELTRRRVGPWAALIPSVLLLFLGYAYETLLWPFNLHTVYALVFGLGALLTLERGDRRGDRAACVLLVLAVAMVEVGIAFAVGVGVAVMMRSDRWRRSWTFLIPLALYAIWWLWARQFDQSTVSLLNVRSIPIDLSDALAAVMGSIFGLNPTGPEVAPEQTGVTAWGTAVAAVAVLALAFRISRGDVPRTLWVSLAVLLVDWVTIAMGGRPPDSSRYIFVGTVMVLLIAADALRGVSLRHPALLGSAAVVALAIPPNIAKLYDGRASHLAGAAKVGTEYAMLELARQRVEPGYMAGADPRVVEAGGGLFIPLPAADYFRAAEEFGSLGDSLEQVRAQSLELRQVADATLVGAFDVTLRSAPAETEPERCPTSADGRPQASVYFPLPRAGVLLGSRSERPVRVAVSRFATGGPGTELGRLDPGAWGAVSIPADSAPDRWRVLVDGPVYVCEPR